MNRFRRLIDDDRVHVFDGAMGTVLYTRGHFVNVCYDELNETEPEEVLEVHREYAAAGAEVLETNTFGANPVKLSSWGLQERTEALNRNAARLAREAAGAEGIVAGAVGPLGIRIEPFGPTSRSEARAYFGRQIEGLVEGGVDAFVLETFTDLEELHQALRAAREAAPELPVVAQMTVVEGGSTSYGTGAETIARSLTEWGADVVGLNCSVGPAEMLEAIERIASVTALPLSAQPNAGQPRAVGDRKIYMASPEYMAGYARRLIEAGVRFVGGCCGTTPDHVRKIRDAVASVQPRIEATRVKPPEGGEAGAKEPEPLERRSGLGAKLARGELVVTVELTPPRGSDPGPLVKRAAALAEAGVDAVSVLDSARAQSRMGVIPAAMLVEREVGVETVIHYTCRDRNMPGMISDLLGAAAGGLRNVLIVTGDPPSMGPYRDATAVFDIDSIGLVNVVHGLNRGLDPGGSPLEGPTRWVTGVALNPGAADLERELDRFYWKVDAGADFAVTQPIFDPRDLERFLERAWERVQRVPVLAGLWPLTSLRNAEFLANEVPGVRVPEETVERMRRAERDGAEAAREEGCRIAREAFEGIRRLVAGVHLNVPGERHEPALRLLEGVREAAGEKRKEASRSAEGAPPR